eukprot:315991-Pyramimonas_sp.AAC.1
MKPRGRRNSVTGPMGALMISLQQLGWDPNQPDVWEDPRGSIWRFKDDDELDFKDIMRTIAQDMEAQLWLKAADHYYGKDMQHGMGTTMLKRTLQKLRKADRVQEAGALEALACGAIWTGQRCKDAGYRTDAKCPRCSRAADTINHTLYECEMNDNLSIEAVV